jgi:hypothetical protein
VEKIGRRRGKPKREDWATNAKNKGRRWYEREREGGREGERDRCR